MKKSFFLLLLLILTASVMACGAPASVIEETKAEGTEQETEEKQVIYKNITADEAKEIMDSESGYVILDVRTEEEYAEGHIPGAILIPDYEIIQKAESILTDKDQRILVYCRSGRRSKNAAEALLALGYTNIWEFGGIIDWNYDIERN